jgi:hypothetical protein
VRGRTQSRDGPRRGFEELAHAAPIGIGRAKERSRQEYSSCTMLIARAGMRRVTGLRAPVESVIGEGVDVLSRPNGLDDIPRHYLQTPLGCRRVQTLLPRTTYAVVRAHSTVRQRTDRSIAHEHAENVDLRRRMMGNDAVKDGWRRFLDRLKRLWGKPRDGETLKATLLNARG